MAIPRLPSSAAVPVAGVSRSLGDRRPRRPAPIPRSKHPKDDPSRHPPKDKERSLLPCGSTCFPRHLLALFVIGSAPVFGRLRLGSFPHRPRGAGVGSRGSFPARRPVPVNGPTKPVVQGCDHGVTMGTGGSPANACTGETKTKESPAGGPARGRRDGARPRRLGRAAVPVPERREGLSARRGKPTPTLEEVRLRVTTHGEPPPKPS